MSSAQSAALFTVSIDLESDPLRPSTKQVHSLAAAADRLAKLLNRYRIAATWGVADPAMSAASDALLAANAGHELAILGDPTWVGPEAGRSRFGKELARRVSHARAAGIDIATLMLRGTELSDHLDLLVKHQIAVVRGSYRRQTTGWLSRPVLQAPAVVRYGIWDVPASLRLPTEGRWTLAGSAARNGRRMIDQAIAAQKVFHLEVDAQSLADSGPLVERQLEHILAHAAQRSTQGALAVGTLSDTAAQLTGDRSNAPARSILHPAA